MSQLLTVQQLPEVNRILKYAETRILKVTGYKADIKINGLSLPTEPKTNLQELMNIVAAYYDVSWLEVISKNRQTNIITARYAFIYLAHKIFRISKSELGRMVLRDHTTIIYSIQQVKNWISINDPIQNELQTIIAKLNETQN